MKNYTLELCLNYIPAADIETPVSEECSTVVRILFQLEKSMRRAESLAADRERISMSNSG
jgi:hypothetical protein